MNYYPWNIDKLAAWMNLEFGSRDIIYVAQSLRVSPHRLHAWQVEPLPRISLDEVRCIAQYRGWSLEKTRQWLGISESHFEDLVQWS